MNITKVEAILDSNQEAKHYNVYFRFDNWLTTCLSYDFERDLYQNPNDDVKFEIVRIKKIPYSQPDRQGWELEIKIDSPYFAIAGVVFMARIQNRLGIDVSPGFKSGHNWFHHLTLIAEPGNNLDPLFNVVAFIKKGEELARYQMIDGCKHWKSVR